MFVPQISDLKRLNKIEKEIEIHARKTLKVPVNAHTILLNTTNSDVLPIVHKSGQSSPNHGGDIYNSSKDIHSIIDTTSQQLPNSILDEKLLVASVSLASHSLERDRNGNRSTAATGIQHSNYRTTIINDKQTKSSDGIDDQNDDDDFNYTDPLIAPLTEATELYTTAAAVAAALPQSGPHAIRGAPRSDFACSGSDCDISWICLFIFILALCFAIPLIYIIYIAEHPEHFHHKESESFVIG